MQGILDKYPGEVRFVKGLRARSRQCRGDSNCRVADAKAVKPTLQPPARFRFIELFAGIGGFRLGLAPLGGVCVFSSEIDALARATLARNFPDRDTLVGDIAEIDAADVPDHDVLTAGFPCQVRYLRLPLPPPRAWLNGCTSSCTSFLAISFALPLHLPVHISTNTL